MTPSCPAAPALLQYCDTEHVRQTIRLFTWRGIAVGVHWSLFVIAALLSFSLSDVALPSSAPGYSTAAYWVAGTATALMFLASIAAHELGHAVVAQRRGIAVKSINLWLFGGVAELEQQPSSWQAELAVGIVGPAVSMLVGGIGMGAAGLLAAMADAQLATQALLWFGSTNLILAGFNLLPGAPLDGGRVFTALRWKHHGDANRARREGARVGMSLASGLIALGIMAVFSGYTDTGLWLAFLGWFLASAARQELAADQARHILAGTTLASVMTPNPVTVPPGLSLGSLVSDVLPRVRGSSIPVVVDGRLAGLITPDHLRSVPPANWWDTEVGSVASPLSAIVTATPYEELSEVLDRQRGGLQRIVVVDSEGRVLGIITPTDLARIIQRAALRDMAEHPDLPLNRRG